MIERSPKAREIMAYTRQLLTVGGYKSFSHADLAEHVGIRKANIHHYFPSKEDLVRVIIQEYRAEAWAGMEAMDRQIHDPLVKVKGYADFWSACIKDGTSSFCICVVLAVELPTLPADIAAEVTGCFSDLPDWSASLLKAGGIQGVFKFNETAEVEASALMAGIHGAMLAARAFNNPLVFDQITWPLINKIIKVAQRLPGDLPGNTRCKMAPYPSHLGAAPMTSPGLHQNMLISYPPTSRFTNRKKLMPMLRLPNMPA